MDRRKCERPHRLYARRRPGFVDRNVTPAFNPRPRKKTPPNLMPGGFDMQGVTGMQGFDMQGGPTDMQGVPADGESDDTGGIVATIEELLTIDALADRLRLKPTTIRKYRSLGLLPEPDLVIGNKPLWKPITIDRWLPTRPGKGVGGGAPMHRRNRERGAA